MVRRYIGYDSLGPKTFKNVRQDEDGYPLVFLEENEIENVTFDFTGYLDTSETISLAFTTDVSGITVSTPTVSSPKVTLTLSSPTSWGEFTLVTDFSTGAKNATTVRVRNQIRAYETIEKSYCD